VIHDVDESLLALVRRDALTDPKVQIVFDAPTKDWVAKRNAPTIDMYLYDIREDLARREVVWEEVRDETGRVTERRPPARRFKLSYLVTAWTNRPEDEHRVLAALLSCFVRHELLPVDLLAGTLADQAMPVYLNVAQPPTADRSLADIWSALGGELKPSLDLAVIAPIPVERADAAGPPVTEEPRFEFLGPDGLAEASAGTPDGRAAARRRRAARAPGRPLRSIEPADREETIVAGTEEQPGRGFRVRGVDR
jgi:Pvc16 N-terminal domain